MRGKVQVASVSIVAETYQINDGMTDLLLRSYIAETDG